MPLKISLPKLGRRGIAASEFAVVVPVLTLLVMASFDIGTRVETSIRLERAASLGAQYAMARPSDMTEVQNRVVAALSGLSGVTVPLPALACECASAAALCTAACPSGLVQTITVTAQRSLSPILLPAMSMATGSAVARAR